MMKSSRLLSLDVFRGITIASMILVNTPGSWQFVYAPLRHSSWDGATPTDLIFPTFLFIVGVSMWFSFKKFNHQLNGKATGKILLRTAIIFCAGLLLHMFPFFGKDLSGIRIMGVLQRIALAYFIGSFIVLIVKQKYLWMVLIVILGIYYGLMVLFGGEAPFSLENNLVLRIDRFILGSKHLYKGFGIPFDPEGLLSTLPSVGTIIIGYLAGIMIGKGRPNAVHSMKMIIYGITAIVAGLIFSVIFPINKPLWSSSYVLYTGGISLLLFSVLYLIIDVIGFKIWTGFFRVLGENALFIYILAGIWTKIMLLIPIGRGAEEISLYTWIYKSLCVPVLGNMNGSLMFALIQVLLLWIPGYLLYRKNIIIKV